MTTDLTFSLGSTFTINAGVDFYAGNFDLTNSGTFNMFGTINSGLGFDFTNTSTGLMNKNGLMFVNGVFNNAGIIQDNGGDIRINGTGNINTGTIYRNGGERIDIGSGEAFNNSGLIVTVSFGSIRNLGTFTNNGTLQVGGFSNGSMGFGVGNFINNGTLQGTGTFSHLSGGNFTNNGTGIIAPGDSPGKLTINGSVSLGSGTYQCEINGTGQGSSYDWLDFIGTATIGGSSKLNIVFGYTPIVGTTFDILTATTVSGTFSFPANVMFSGGGVGAISLSYPSNNKVRVTIESLLPVELVSFTAKEQQNKVLLDWSTASEQNNRGFEVQRSGDGTNWETLDFLTGNGTATDAHHYVYLDEKPLPNVNYYRLRQMDFDGKTQYSPTVAVKLKQTGSGLRLYPNPASGAVNLAFESDQIGEATLTLYGLTGEPLLTNQLPLNGHKAHSKIELSGLPSGVYLLELRAGNDRWQERLLVEQ
jgi:hypothetical protein